MMTNGETTDTPNVSDIEKLESEHSAQVADESKTIEKADEIVRKRGRPKGSKNRPRDGSVPVAQSNDIRNLLPKPIVKALLGLPYNLIAKKYGEHWNLSDAESESMVECHLALAQKYLPDYLKQNVELYTCALMHGMIIFGKMELHYRLINERKQKEELKPGFVDEKTNAKDNSIPGQDGLRKEFSGVGVHKN